MYVKNILLLYLLATSLNADIGLWNNMRSAYKAFFLPDQNVEVRWTRHESDKCNKFRLSAPKYYRCLAQYDRNREKWEDLYLKEKMQLNKYNETCVNKIVSLSRKSGILYMEDIDRQCKTNLGNSLPDEYTQFMKQCQQKMSRSWCNKRANHANLYRRK